MSVKPTIRNAVHIRTGVHDTYSSPVWNSLRVMRLGWAPWVVYRNVGAVTNPRRG